MTTTDPPPGLVCETHQVRHGPRGCPRCRHEAHQAQRAERDRFRRTAVVVLVPLLAFGIWLALRPGPQSPRRLDPAPYREAITTIESVLYAREFVDGGDRYVLSQALRGLEQDLKHTFPSVAQREALKAIGSWAMVTRVKADPIDARLDIPALRARWEQLRGEHFQTAEWFRQGSADLEDVQYSDASRGLPDDPDAYQRTMDQLMSVLQDVNKVFSALPPRGRSASESVRREWDFAVSHVPSDLAAVRGNLPLYPADRDRSWQQAHTALDAAITAAEQLIPADAAKLPDRLGAQQRYSKALWKVSVAQRAIDGAPR